MPRPISALTRFLRTEAAGGVVLLVATAVALLWANSTWSGGYADLWSTRGSLPGTDLGPADLHHWVNDGLMAVFFFVAGLEIKRELVVGELSTRRAATLPVVAAVGGMVVPAVVYTAVNLGAEGAAGWGIPMATDIAFALGVLAILGDRVPLGLKALLLGLAIVDDIGAIAVIAIFYADEVSLGWLAVAGAGLAAIAALLRRSPAPSVAPIAVVLAAAVWLVTYESGVHATIAGVALAAVVPVDRAEPLESRLHSWASFVVLPLFALANAGVALTGDAVGDATSSTVAVGTALGLVVGKPVGIAVAAWLAVRWGWASLPDGVGWIDVVGMAVLAGIGFTVSLFVAGLAFDDPALHDQARVGVLAGSLVAAVVGSLLLRPRWHDRRT